ncbi:MAG: flagellar hook-associated protein 3 [Calditrichaeota bacterium]|nr:flagellar hook-associated protein 3 [Calditrichota bacterium]
MRVTNQMMSSNFIMNVNSHLEKLNRLQEEISSGKRVNKPSDDPSSASRIMELEHRLKMNGQYQKNIQNGITRLNDTESNLNTLQNIITRARNLAIQGSNSTLSRDDMDGLAIEVNHILEETVSLSNKKSFDDYLFAGTYGKEPFKVTRDGDGEIVGVQPAGDVSGKVNRQVNASETIQINIENKGLFTGDQTVFEDLIDLRDALREGDKDKVSDVLGQLNTRLDTITERMSEVGVKINALDDRNNLIETENLSLSQFLGDLQDTDIAQAIVNYQQEQLAYQAALQAGGQMLQQAALNFFK